VFTKVLDLLKLKGHLFHLLPKGGHQLSLKNKALLQLIGASAGGFPGINRLAKVTSKPLDFGR
jgi:hypothetical protein